MIGLGRDAPVRVSVCTPALNAERHLGDAIESVLGQTLDDWELVICDNASTDATPEVVARYEDPRIRYFRYRIRVPMVFSFNRCFEHVRGEYVICLCADDRLTPSGLERLAAALDAHPTAGLAVARRQQDIDDAGNPIGPVKVHPLGPGLVDGHEAIRAQCRAPITVGLPPQVLARTEVVLEESGFAPRADHALDNDLFTRILDRWDAVYVEDATFHYRWHEAMHTYANRAAMEDIRSDVYVFERLFRESAAVGGDRRARRSYVRHRLYPWFERALGRAARGDLRAAVWILSRIARFAPVPWWVPYYAYLFCKSRLKRAWRAAARVRLGGRWHRGSVDASEARGVSE